MKCRHAICGLPATWIIYYDPCLSAATFGAAYCRVHAGEALADPNAISAERIDHERPAGAEQAETIRAEDLRRHEAGLNADLAYRAGIAEELT